VKQSERSRSGDPAATERRPALVLVALGVAAWSLVACGGGSAGDPVTIGPGTDETPPAERALEGTPGEEPAWVARVPEVAQPRATARERAATLELAGGASGLTAPPSDGPMPSGAEVTTEQTYAGQMEIEIAYYNYCVTYDGNLAYAGSARYAMAAEVYLNPPAEDEGIAERSPFNLIAATEYGVEGSILLMSAQVVANVESGDTVLLDYWDLDQDADGSIAGVLTDRWPGFAYNDITTAQPLVPCQPDIVLAQTDDVAEGAQLSGSVTDDHVHLEILGQSLDQEIRFFAVIDADRAA